MRVVVEKAPPATRAWDINVVYHLDHPPTPDYRKKLTTFVNSKWWLVALIALGTVLTLAATNSEEFGKLLEWFATVLSA